MFGLLQVRTQHTNCSSSDISSEQKHESSGSVFALHFCFALQYRNFYNCKKKGNTLINTNLCNLIVIQLIIGFLSKYMVSAPIQLAKKKSTEQFLCLQNVNYWDYGVPAVPRLIHVQKSLIIGLKFLLRDLIWFVRICCLNAFLSYVEIC